MASKAFEIHLTSMVRRWKATLTEADSAYIFSPYITSSTAETVLTVGTPNAWHIHTLFEARIFAAGSSSTTTLRKLLGYGCHLYHLPNLHAKVLLIPGAWASVGSQNLTANGTRNREATASTVDLRSLQLLEGGLAEWMSTRSPINGAMLDDMQALLPELRRTYKKFSEMALNTDLRVSEKEKKRQNNLRHDALRPAAANKYAQNQEHDRHLRESRLARELNTLDKSPRRFGKVEMLDTGDNGSSSTRSFVVRKSDLTQWWIGKELVALLRTRRYLTVIENTGQLGWARVVKTRITFIGTAIDWSNPIQINGSDYTIRFEATTKSDAANGVNLIARLGVSGSKDLLSIKSWFSPAGLRCVSVDEPRPSRWGGGLKRVIHTDWDKTSAILLERPLEPFKYSTALHGAEADQFFGPVGTAAWISLARLRRHPLLVINL